MSRDAATGSCFLGPLEACGLRFLAPQLGAPAATVLEIGCGDGRRTAGFAQAGALAVGVDISEETVQSARATFPTCHFLAADAQALPFPDETFDAVWSCSVLQYVDHQATIRETARVLRPGGRAVFLENLGGSPPVRAYRRLHRLMRWGYPDHQNPQHYLALSEISLFEEVFSRVSIQPAHILTAAALVVPTVLRLHKLHRPIALGPWRHLLPLLTWMDELLLDAFPSIRSFAWFGLVLAQR